MTLYGACGISINPLFKISGSNNKEDFLFFLKEVRKVTVGKLIVVLDNHRAHHANVVKEYVERIGMLLLFMPLYSC